MQDTINRLMEDEFILEAFERKKNSPQYALMQEIFKSFLHGVELEKKLKTD